jgi:hypothetical protein
MGLKDFFNWNKKEQTPKELIDFIFKSLSSEEVRVSYTNIYGDVESCAWEDWDKQVRSTNNIKDITHIIIYNNKEPIFIRIAALEVRVVEGKNSKVTSISKDDVAKMIEKLQKIK